MADYLIQDTTLDAIADAINAKTGGSSAMTPAQMVTAIGNIPSGGGGEKVLTKLGEYTVSSAVSRIDITLTEDMLSCEALYIKFDDITLSETDWIYPTLNSYSPAGGGMGYTEKQSRFTGTIVCTPIKNAFSVTRRIFVGSLMQVEASREISSPNELNLRLYTSSVTFNSGTIEVWGYV